MKQERLCYTSCNLIAFIYFSANVPRNGLEINAKYSYLIAVMVVSTAVYVNKMVAFVNTLIQASVSI